MEFSGAFERVQGCACGAFIGDLLGAQFKQMRARTASSLLESILKQQPETARFLPVPPSEPCPAPSAHLCSAIALCNTLCAHSGYKPDEVVKVYAACPHIPTSLRRSVQHTSTTDNSLSFTSALARSLHPSQGNVRDFTNTALMRVFPLAMCVRVSDELIERWVTDDCSLTNPSEIVKDSCVALCAALRAAVRTGNRLLVYQAALLACKTETVRRILLDASEKDDAGIPDVFMTSGDVAECDGAHASYYGIALFNAFYTLLHCQTVEDALHLTIARGGDTSVNSSIACSLLGATLGPSRMPTSWRDAHGKKMPNVDNLIRVRAESPA